MKTSSRSRQVPPAPGASVSSDGPVAEPWAEGAAFRVKVHAGARRRRVIGWHDGALKVEIETAPERGKANKALVAYLAGLLGVAASELALLDGDHRPRKRFGARGMSAETLRERLRGLCPDGGKP